MKIFWFIFSLFIFTLTVMPCCGDECQDDISLTCSTPTEDHHDEDSEKQNLCSPFCTCTTCGIYACDVEQSHIVKMDQGVTQVSNHKGNPYTFQFTSEFEVTIWQPPKLV
jgi:hypothetical protein